MNKIFLYNTLTRKKEEFKLIPHSIGGPDEEVAKEIAKDLGQELEIKDMGFDGLLAALNSGNVDFVMAGMNSTEERKCKDIFRRFQLSLWLWSL